MLVIDVYSVLLIVAMHAACVTRPHVVGPDGSLRIRYGALFDLRIPADEIVGARVERRYPEGRLIQQRDDGSLELIVASQTTVTVELTAPVRYVARSGRRGGPGPCASTPTTRTRSSSRSRGREPHLRRARVRLREPDPQPLPQRQSRRRRPRSGR